MNRLTLWLNFILYFLKTLVGDGILCYPAYAITLSHGWDFKFVVSLMCERIVTYTLYSIFDKFSLVVFFYDAPVDF